MKIAILVEAHRNAPQINEMISAFGDESFDFFVHVDKKSDIQKEIVKKDNVFILGDTERVDVSWSGYGQVEATLNLLKKANSRERERERELYNYYWLISGEDFPTKHRKEIIRFFEEREGKEFISFATSKNRKAGKETFFDKRNAIYWPRLSIGRTFLRKCFRHALLVLSGGHNRTFRLWRRKNKTGLPIYYGPNWWCLSHNAVAWMLDYLSKHPEFEKYYKYGVPHSDESFFHTLFMASPHRENQHDFTPYTHFDPGASSPIYLSMKYFEEIVSNEHLTCRKVDKDFDKEFYKRLLDIQKEK